MATHPPRTDLCRELGAIPTPEGVRFTVWAPNATDLVEVDVHPGHGPSDFPDGIYPLVPKGEGYHAATIPGPEAGAWYTYRLDRGDAFPDPCSRYQPEGPHGPSEVVDSSTFTWMDDDWRGISPDAAIIYECHVGTMTPEGTFAALERELPELKRLGVNVVEIMPVAECPGRWNWGYDGVALYAPFHHYGRPDDFRSLVDTAHELGLAVILDVVYNHLGPDGNYLRVYAQEYFTDRHQTDWGDALNFDGENSRPVRDWVIGNACHWIDEYHLDGFRLDATHAILDDSPTHVIAELTERVRALAEPRRLLIYAEDGRNDVSVIQPRSAGGWGCDGIWADDFHHEVHVYLTDERDGYYQDYVGTPESIASVIANGFTYQGQVESRTGEPRGTLVTDEPASAFVFGLQNHDQIGNRATGDRLHHLINLDQYHVASVLALLSPETPLLFQGQEFRASAPFLYFTDHYEDLGHLVTEGRRREFGHFGTFADKAARERIPDPQAESTFQTSVLDLSERERHADTYGLYQRLLTLRADDPVLSVQDRARTATFARGNTILLHRWANDGHRLVIANFGDAVSLELRTLPGAVRWPSASAKIMLRMGADVDAAEETEVRERIEIPRGTAVLLGD